ncbi:hypothetical protein [Hydrogenothermus marinus]|uniref:Uncharacterized protein n=1 Tax=Hydrogenothermus marinus TaxID=133270 RepID=A0A3M0B7U0_9AQUI|nr:hypothetical protein [Hydrogenothermus marinus]RMA93211.1 hypothetical protein CLV39_1267 [Hydrogenothermus marinus]
MRIAFIDFKELNNTVKAGILLTDEHTKPIEFRTTTNINIDELQRILYGESLKEVLYKERFAVDLANSLKEDFDILLTKEKNILSIRKEIGKPVGYIRKFDPFKALDKHSHKIVNLAGKFEPLVLTISKEDEKNLYIFSKNLQKIYKNFNLLEPFERVKKALEYLST